MSGHPVLDQIIQSYADKVEATYHMDPQRRVVELNIIKEHYQTAVGLWATRLREAFESRLRSVNGWEDYKVEVTHLKASSLSK